MRIKLLLIGVIATGCSAQLGNSIGNGTSDDSPDAGAGSGSGSGGADAGVTGTDASSSTASCANGRVVYLNFEGAAVTRGSPSDATVNRISWMSNANATVPRYRTNDGNRLTLIQNITDGVRARLAATKVQVVTTRPAAGPYVMILFGGTNTNIGTIYTGSTNEHDCGDAVKSDVGWISDASPTAEVADVAVGSVGWGLGLNGTNSPTDCMCSWSNNCQTASGACSLSASIATTQSLSPATTCPNLNPQDEIAAFTTKFCQ